MRFDWDAAKNDWTLQTRGFDFDYVSQVFDGPMLRVLDTRKEHGEVRAFALGAISGRVYAIAYTMREPRICRIISARKANEREAKDYWSALAQ